VSVVGNAGSGKSSLARRIADKLGVTCIELDAIHHLAGWQAIDPDEFLRRVEAITAEETWVVDGNYRTVVVDGPVWGRADTVVWLDLPRATVMRQVAWRSVRRVLRRQHLWNGNREPLVNLCPWRSESIVNWAWTQHRKYEDRFGRAMVAPELEHIDFVRLRSHEEADAWVSTLRVELH
jgi:adenylate kinase family enzyme